MKQEDQAPRSYLVHWIITAVGIVAIITFVMMYQPAKELAWESFRVIFSLVSTPFVLEFTVGITGTIILIYINSKRRAKEEKDEWVLMEVDDDDPVSEPKKEATTASTENG